MKNQITTSQIGYLLSSNIDYAINALYSNCKEKEGNALCSNKRVYEILQLLGISDSIIITNLEDWELELRNKKTGEIVIKLE